MNKPLALIALGASVLWLSACDKTPTTVPMTPMVNTPVAAESRTTAGTAADSSVYTPVAAESRTTAGSSTDPSVPSAQAALPPPNAIKAEQTPGRSNGTLSAAQESTAMPMPGQNNDHSAPLGPAKRASSP